VADKGVIPKELSFLPNVFGEMLQVDEMMDCLEHFYHHEPRKTLILDEIIDIVIRNKFSWTLIEK
jgi:hypothetical protein